MARHHHAFALASFALAAGCTTVESHFTETVPAAGLQRIEATVDAGDVSLRGSASSTVRVDGRAWGRAGAEERATARHDANQWAVAEAGGALTVAAHNPLGGGVDFSILAPPLLHSQLTLRDGDATLTDMRGRHLVSADSIFVDGLGGHLTLQASGQVEGRLALAPGDVVEIHAEWGDVNLELPLGLEYDIQVWADPEAGIAVEDLGFHAVATDAGFVAARSGRGNVRIDIFAPSGSVEISSGPW